MHKGKFVKRRGVATKTMIMILALVMIVGCTIGGTLAWLTDKTDAVTNTFTVGNITINLAETTTDYKIVPGGKSAKDPVITVVAGSEKCYVYASVDNNVVLNGTAVATPNIVSTDWLVVGTSGTKTLYRYKNVVDAASADVPLAVFTEVSYADTITKGDMTTLNGKTIVIQGYAHQSEYTDQTTADAAALAWAGIETATN